MRGCIGDISSYWKAHEQESSSIVHHLLKAAVGNDERTSHCSVYEKVFDALPV